MNRLHTFLLLHVLTCLQQNAHGSDIVHGEKAPENSLLYMVSLQNNKSHVCGGFLVTEDFVVTAAHCVDSKPTHVVLGTHNLKELQSENIEIGQKIIHPSYQNVGKGDDIMLLKLANKTQLNSRVQTIQLPSGEINLEDNEICQVAGWGKTSSNGPSVDELRVVNVSVINPQKCKKIWHHLPAKVICAGGYGTNKGFCQGDSGGPLVCKGKAVGVVSANRNYICNYPDLPNVYTDISKHLEWINKVVKKGMNN
ncbi:duodenase-1-like isoform X2 [Mugil cephalus]|uniref:duodenase-1-like isoform X2 n=1 Tax=Mugil cephalus TaxID=48193 RepID=UPI001FB74936|nr:duodenase-1-like isoform X2 [Mugil cephalus]